MISIVDNIVLLVATDLVQGRKFVINRHNVCINPMILQFTGKHIKWTLSIAEYNHNQWCYGYNVSKGIYAGESSPCSPHYTNGVPVFYKSIVEVIYEGSKDLYEKMSSGSLSDRELDELKKSGLYHLFSMWCDGEIKLQHPVREESMFEIWLREREYTIF